MIESTGDSTTRGMTFRPDHSVRECPDHTRCADTDVGKKQQPGVFLVNPGRTQAILIDCFPVRGSSAQ
jgi:hypothetical protein